MDDKIREEFEKWWRSIDGDNYPFDRKRLCLNLYVSRDSEVQRLEAENKKLQNEIEHLAICLNQASPKVLKDCE